MCSAVKESDDDDATEEEEEEGGNAEEETEQTTNVVSFSFSCLNNVLLKGPEAAGAKGDCRGDGGRLRKQHQIRAGLRSKVRVI